MAAAPQRPREMFYMQLPGGRLTVAVVSCMICPTAAVLDLCDGLFAQLLTLSGACFLP